MELIHLEGYKRYWVVRPGSGSPFLSHFEQNNCIAIGHIDEVPFSTDGTITGEDIDTAVSHINQAQQQKEAEERDTVAQISKKVGAARTFVCELSIGDVILSPKDDAILIGTVTSEPFISSTPLRATKANGEINRKELTYKLRRKVQWDGVKVKSFLPWQLKDSLRTSQTIFSLDQHKTLLEHWLYSIFINESGLHFSTRISQTTAIKQFQVTEFQRLIQKLELIADLIVADEVNTENTSDFLEFIDSMYYRYGLAQKFTLTTSQSFASPGNIWSYVPLLNTENKKKLLVLALLVQSSFAHATPDDLPSSGLLTQAEISQINNASSIIRTAGHFDEFRSGLNASLDERRKTTVNVEPQSVPVEQRVVFPEVSSEGDTGR